MGFKSPLTMNQWAWANPSPSTSGPTTTSATPVVVPEMTATVVVAGGNVKIDFSGSFVFAGGTAGTFGLYRDGSLIANSDRAISFTDAQGALDPSGSITLNVALSAMIAAETSGSHTYEARWSRSSGTLTGVTTKRSFIVAEMPFWFGTN